MAGEDTAQTLQAQMSSQGLLGMPRKVEEPVKLVFNSHLQQNFDRVPGMVGDIKSERPLLSQLLQATATKLLGLVKAVPRSQVIPEPTGGLAKVGLQGMVVLWDSRGSRRTKRCAAVAVDEAKTCAFPVFPVSVGNC